MTSVRNFALIGAAGYIAPRHMQAIQDTGGRLVAAMDLHDCVGRLDSYFPDARFFTEYERFDRHIEKLRRQEEADRVHFISVCSPNYLHDAHVRLALRTGASAICEKPLVVSPWNIDALQELESESKGRVYNVLQLRLLPSLIALKKQIAETSASGKADICLSYITRRGAWYQVSWKGQKEKSGGVAMNIGIHFFDLLLWLFGEPEHSEVHLNEPTKMSGLLRLEKANIRWFLSTDVNDLPNSVKEQGGYAHRSMTYDGQEIEFSKGFTDLHTRVYEDILAGGGFGLADAKPAIKLAHAISNTPASVGSGLRHPFLIDSPVPQRIVA
ncbi:Gfo/Idh/MocA family oxidoreductase [Roseimaritima ulvae]|uniref:UDP-N-acetyl-2-amino-2-deoxy-D-glucuronate oxidase n=1 Tax=Roseimaritima ulvae TaxID=980254 RepID=A0A5B9R0Q3_9BACT|nr:Gfo/Idh/MocA family oxidoreductase [Roseimaritima ulvae]QEG42996.1 UDP-N-acetyl-2-amino-2-deoxy-D-glucuronate oxidase [Roseimaritima ulvae]